jgi:hypothetical protein
VTAGGGSAEAYRRHGPLTDPGHHGPRLAGLSADAHTLIAIVQGLLIHDAARERLYGPLPPDPHPDPRRTLGLAARLDRVLARDDAPLVQPRPPGARSTGTCRDFALVLCGLLRQTGTPARVRCGFADYLAAGCWADHWVCERWDAATSSWCLADAQLDPEHRAALGIDFDIAAVPRHRFLTADRAWRACRSGAADPERFGHGAVTGLWFVRVNLERDRLARSGHETSDWDGWRAVPAAERVVADADLPALDRLARAGAGPATARPAG